jgi:hypothetical protein
MGIPDLTGRRDHPDSPIAHWMGDPCVDEAGPVLTNLGIAATLDSLISPLLPWHGPDIVAPLRLVASYSLPP